MDLISPEIYAEVYQILNVYAFVYDRIPRRIIKYIKRHASRTFKVQYPMQENILNYVSREALEVYTSLYIEYVANDSEKEELKQILVSNEVAARQ